jgi:deoxycytidine triphosphate deaminase
MHKEWPDELNILSQSQIIGEATMEKYIGFLDKHGELLTYDGNGLDINPGAVLLSDKIKDLCDESKTSLPLIHPFDENNLKAGSYHLSLGSKYRIDTNQKVDYLTNEKNTLTIPPNGIAIVTTNEWVNIPRFLIARWNLRVRAVYRGLVWVGSLQVDPGYQGFLFCPLYNLSNINQTLVYQKPLFTIDFVLTTQFDIKNGKIWEPDKNDKYSTFSFDRLDIDKIQSAPLSDINSMGKRIDEIKDELKSHGKSMNTFQTTTFTVLAVIITAVTVLATLSSVFGK